MIIMTQLNSHFIPAIIKKIHDLKISNKNQILVWGDGKPKREVIHVDDIADACVYFMKKKQKITLINIGTGKDYSIDYYVNLISKLILNKKIKIKYDKSKPNGVYRKVMDVIFSKKIWMEIKKKLNDAILETYKSFKKEIRLKNILIVTGGAGFVGSNLISYLLNKTKFKIISIDNYSTGSKKII